MRQTMAFLLVAATVAPAAAPAESARTIALYARALQAFNPSLGAGDAGELARVTIAQADAFGLDARLLVALIAVESRWHSDAVSPAGALGLGQLMPQTAAGLGVDPNDPEQNIAGAARHLRELLDRYRDHGEPERS